MKKVSEKTMRSITGGVTYVCKVCKKRYLSKTAAYAHVIFSRHAFKNLW